MTSPAKPSMGTIHDCLETAPGDLGANAAGRQMLETFSWVCPVCNRTWVSLLMMDRGSAPKAKWVSTSLPGQPSLFAAVAALQLMQAQPRQAAAAVAALLANATVEITATWDTSFPDANYLYDWQLPSALIGKVTVTQKTKTASAVVLTVKATSATLVAATINLIGVRLG